MYELAGRPALERLRTEIASLTPEEQALALRGLLAGIVIDENRPEYDIGNFLMRGLLGADEQTGALVDQQGLEPSRLCVLPVTTRIRAAT